MSSAPREATVPLTRWQYFTKTLYQNAAAKNLFVYNKVIYEKDEALRQTEEDNLCAAYIKCLLEGGAMDLAAEIPVLQRTSGAKFFDPAQQDVFPEPDFWLSTQADRFDFVLRLKRGADGLDEMERIDV